MLTRLPLPLLAALSISACGVPSPLPGERFAITEATIADIHAALRDESISCVDIVASYLDRTAAYDKRGPALNAIIKP